VTTVLVDAENVRRSVWPNIGPAELVELCAAWARAEGVEVVAVFDGSAPAGAVGTGAESADDWIAREAARLRESGEVFWLVTSDRELRDRASAGAERVTGGGSFARELQSSTRD
jgi:hypothetical protein